MNTKKTAPRWHPKIPEGLLKGNKFLENSFQMIEGDDERLSCLLCSETAPHQYYYENLEGHFQSHLNNVQDKAKL
jgi:hypothetical protein